ncbi:hypothetical protein Tco_0085367 [Tanacetum coccineum]
MGLLGGAAGTGKGGNSGGDGDDGKGIWGNGDNSSVRYNPSCHTYARVRWWCGPHTSSVFKRAPVSSSDADRGS